MNTLLITPKQNRLLAALPTAEYLRLEPELELVALSPGQVIYEAGDTLDFLYFPTSGIVSLMWMADDGATSELAMTGNDGLIGVPSALGSETTAHRVCVQIAGNAYRIRSEVAHWLLQQGGELPRRVILYTHALMNQIAQVVLCSRHHSVEQQLCRWILLCLDRLLGVQIHTTQAVIANLLGVRREAISAAAGKLQAAGLMTYRRGCITIQDRPGLEARACGCYAALKQTSDRLPQSQPNDLNPPRVHLHPKSLRARAETQLKHKSVAPARTPVETDRLLHELQVHQIELEMQNEELTSACAEADAIRSHYADIYDFAPVAYVTLDALGVVRQINLTGAILLGIKRSQITQHRFSASVLPALLPAFNQFLSEVLGQRTRKTCEFELNPTQQRASAIVQIDAISDEDGLECRMVIADVTTQRRIEHALRERDQYQRALLDNFPFMVWLKDDESRFLAVNRPFADQFGWPSAESLIGKTDFDITSPDLAEGYRADDRAVLESGRSKIVEEWIEDHGERRWSETFKSPVTLDEQVIGTVGFARDITERKLAEEELRIAAVAFASQNGMVITDPKGVILRVNSAFSEITGFSAEDAIGQTMVLLKSGRHDKLFYQRLWAALREKGVWQGEIWNKRKNGQIYAEMLSITAINTPDGGITHYVASFTDITENKEAEAEIHRLAYYDALTKLPNRRLLQDRLGQAVAATTRSGLIGALFFIDLDNFKALNDTRGHDVGDQLLVEVAQRLRAAVREGDTVARQGGDEFVVLMEDLGTEIDEAAALASQLGDKLRGAIDRPFELKGYDYHCKISIGVGLFDKKETGENLFKHADLALYQAKNAGRNTLRFFDPAMQEALDLRSALEAELRLALKRQELQLYYQPQVDGAQRIIGVEALLRWQHPERGLVSPNDFIPLAEDSGLILPIGLWVLETACALLKSWEEDSATRELTIAVNVSARQFRQPDFVEQVQQVLETSRVNPAHLKLELTESLVLEDVKDTIAKIEAIKHLGVSFAMDDFGTGYSSLSYLTRLPIDQLKIDRSFVSSLPGPKSDETIARTIITMGGGLDMHVIAEGVETEEQRQFLEAHGCHAYQGYFFSRPLPLDELAALLKKDMQAGKR